MDFQNAMISQGATQLNFQHYTIRGVPLEYSVESRIVFQKINLTEKNIANFNSHGDLFDVCPILKIFKAGRGI